MPLQNTWLEVILQEKSEIMFNPLTDPYASWYEQHDMKDLTSEEKKKVARTTILLGCAYYVILCIALILCALLGSCSTPKLVSSESSDHRIENIIQRMDSMMASHTVVQQDSAWRETILKQFQSIREKSDTSHTMVVDTAGNIIREKIIINNVLETTSETDRQEHEVLMHRLEVMDSTMNMMRQEIQHSDSLLQQKQTVIEKPVEKKLSRFQQMQIWLGRLVLLVFAVLAGWWIMKKRMWWLALLRKLI